MREKKFDHLYPKDKASSYTVITWIGIITLENCLSRLPSWLTKYLSRKDFSDFSYISHVFRINGGRTKKTMKVTAKNKLKCGNRKV